MVKTAAEIEMDKSALRDWELKDRETSRNALERARKMLPIALREYVSPLQRDYLLAYFGEGKTMQAIAEEYGVNKATVSRTINRALDRLYSHLRFVDPMFSELEGIRSVLRIDRKKGCKQKKQPRRPPMAVTYHKKYGKSEERPH